MIKKYCVYVRNLWDLFIRIKRGIFDIFHHFFALIKGNLFSSFITTTNLIYFSLLPFFLLFYFVGFVSLSSFPPFFFLAANLESFYFIHWKMAGLWATFPGLFYLFGSLISSSIFNFIDKYFCLQITCFVHVLDALLF